MAAGGGTCACSCRARRWVHVDARVCGVQSDLCRGRHGERMHRVCCRRMSTSHRETPNHRSSQGPACSSTRGCFHDPAGFSRKQRAGDGARSVALTTLRGETHPGHSAGRRRSEQAGCDRRGPGRSQVPPPLPGQDARPEHLIRLQSKAVSWFCLLAEGKGVRARDSRKDYRICEFRLFPLVFVREPREQPM